MLQCFSGSSQSTGQFHGKIVDAKTLEPMPFSTITIDTFSLKTLSDINGLFIFKNIPFSTFHLKIKAQLFDTISQKITVNKDSTFYTFELNFKGKTLEAVVVTENTFDGLGSVRKMRAIEGVLISKGKKTEVISLEKMNTNKSANIGRQIYAHIPGLNIWESDGAGLQLGIGGRGLSPTRTSNFNTRQNGYDISADALGYPESYYTPPTEAVEEIQLIRGAASLQFGTQFGGLLNFVLKKGPENKPIEVTARHTLGSFNLNSSFLSIGGSKNTWNYYAYYQYKFGNDWRAFSAFKVHSAGIQIEKHLTEKSIIKLDLTKMYYLTQQPGGLTDNQFITNPHTVNRERNWFEVDWNLAALNYDYEFNNQTRLNSRFFGLMASRKATGYLGQINRIDPLDERNLISGIFKNFGNETRFLKIYKFKEMAWAYLIGFRYYQGNNDSKQGLTSSENSADFTFLNKNYIDGSAYLFPSKNISIFAEHIFNITQKLSFTPGVRFEHISTNADGLYRNTVLDLAGNIIYDTLLSDTRSNNRSFLISGIGVNYKFNDTVELYSNFSQNYRSINFTDMQIINPNFRIDPNLQDERGFNFDLGFKGGIKNKVNFDVSGFSLLYKNRIGTTIKEDSLLFSTYQYRTNIAKSITIGVEAVVEVELLDFILKARKHNSVLVFINTSYVSARYFDSDEEAFNDKKVELVPPLTFKTGFTYRHKNFSATYQYSFTAQHFSDATNSKSQANAVNGIIPSYHIMDLSLKYKYRWFQIETGVNNVLNEFYFTRRATAYPGPGIIPSAPRNFYITLQVKL